MTLLPSTPTLHRLLWGNAVLFAVVNLKIPIEIAQRVKELLDDLRTENDSETRLTYHNILRLILEEGLPAVESMASDEITERVAKSGVAMGRPRAASR